jgi:hypothetical protein
MLLGLLWYETLRSGAHQNTQKQNQQQQTFGFDDLAAGQSPRAKELSSSQAIYSSGSHRLCDLSSRSLLPLGFAHPGLIFEETRTLACRIEQLRRGTPGAALQKRRIPPAAKPPALPVPSGQ